MTATAVDLDALARETIVLGEAATPGPWRECGHDRNGCKCGIVWSIPVDHTVVSPVLSGEESALPESIVKANAALIAAYRTSAPALATALLAAREAMREAHTALDACLGGYTKSERTEGLTKPNNGSPFALSVRAIARLESALRSGAGQGEGGGG